MPQRTVKIRTMVLSGILSALMAVCAWLSLPLGAVCVTMQLFAVILALELLGGRWGCVSILTYLLLGAVGLPVFSGFRGGIGMLLGATGGFLLGFLVLGLVYWLAASVFGTRGRLPGLILGLLGCYGFGSGWFAALYGGSLASVAAVCVAPYLIPDLCKLAMALSLAARLKPRLIGILD